MQVELIDKASVQNDDDIDKVLWEREEYWQEQLFTLSHWLNNLNEWYALNKRSYRKYIFSWFIILLKGNPKFQGTLNWILQILLITAVSNTKISKTYSLLNKILLSLSILLSVYCDLCFLPLSQRQMFFSSWTQCTAKFQTSQVIIRAIA